MTTNQLLYRWSAVKGLIKPVIFFRKLAEGKEMGFGVRKRLRPLDN
jgi:hypothetical protein